MPSAFAIGQTVQLKASASLPDGTHLDATGQVTWQSSALAVVTVSAAGLLTVVAPGEADVIATLQTVRSVGHVVVLKPVPPAPSYDISGVVHESAPTENVMVAGATVGIHFAGCPSRPNDNQSTTTDDSGRFELTGIGAAGFALVVSKPGYDSTSYRIAQLPRDQHSSIGLVPAAGQRAIRVSGTNDCVDLPFALFRRPGAIWGGRVYVRLPVHRNGILRIDSAGLVLPFIGSRLEGDITRLHADGRAEQLQGFFGISTCP